MPDLTPEAANEALASMGLTPQDEDDLIEITHRLNALREALESLDLPDLDSQEPVTVFPEEGAGS